MRQRVVITGMGVLSPLGIGLEPFWEGLIAGRSGIRPIESFDTSDYSIHRGAEVPGFDPLAYMSAATAERVGRGAQFAIAATRMALADARLDLAEVAPERIGVTLGTTYGETQAIERIVRSQHQSLPADARDLEAFPAYQIPANVAAEFGLAGPNVLIPTACAAGNYAIGYALDLIRDGVVDVMLTGGVDPISQIGYTGFHRVNGMASEYPRPFSLDRDGMMVGEGAAVLVLESFERAQARGATIYAEVLGYGLACDAHHMTAPHPAGEGALRAMHDALAHAELAHERIDYINAHGTGTQANDKAETLALKSLLGERALLVPVSSIKSMLGHTMGAASALEAAACALIVQRGVIPPTANYSQPDPECDLDYVPNEARWREVKVAMSNAYAFGGNDASLIIGQLP